MDISKEFNEFVRNPQMYKFLLVGIGTASHLLFFTILLTSMLNIHYTISVAISYQTAIIWSFFVHDNWTFAKVQKKTSKKSRFLMFNIISLVGLGVNEVVLIFFTTQVNLHYIISEVIAIFVAFFFNFQFQKKVSWRN